MFRFSQLIIKFKLLIIIVFNIGNSNVNVRNSTKWIEYLNANYFRIYQQLRI